MAKVVTLNRKKVLFVEPKAPYNFDATVFKPSHYPSPLEFYEKGRYWLALGLKNKIFGIKLEDKGTLNRPKIKATIYSASTISEKELHEISKEMSFRFEFDRDISGFYAKLKKDKSISPFLKRWYGMHGSCNHSLYELLMIGIFLQNTVVKRSMSMTKSMLEKYGIKVIFDRKEVYAFWKPEEMAKTKEKALRRLKVGYRAKLFIRLSQTFIKENIDESEIRTLPAAEAKKRVMKLYGVGPETARILLFEALHHYDIFEHVAPWQQKILSRLLFGKELVPQGKIIKYAQTQWKEWSALAVHYIWEDIFWRRQQGQKIEWLEKEIRL
jgi:3-methyladenine DNA glycosylase/8-oxoguanine DNA glycosylase